MVATARIVAGYESFSRICQVAPYNRGFLGPCEFPFQNGISIGSSLGVFSGHPYDQHTHTHTHTRARARTHTHWQTQSMLHQDSNSPHLSHHCLQCWRCGLKWLKLLPAIDGFNFKILYLRITKSKHQSMKVKFIPAVNKSRWLSWYHVGVKHSCLKASILSFNHTTSIMSHIFCNTANNYTEENDNTDDEMRHEASERDVV